MYRTHSSAGRPAPIAERRLRPRGPGVAGLALALGHALHGLSGGGAACAVEPPRVDELTVTTLQTLPNPARGRVAYRRDCAGCHGPEGWGSDEHAVPALAGQHMTYLVREMASFIEADRLDADMHRALAASRHTRPQRLADLAAHLEAAPPNPAPTTGDGTDLELGADVYRRLCAACHRADGSGSREDAIPSLRGQHYAVQLAQLRRVAAGHRFSTLLQLQALFDGLSLRELEAVTDYASRLGLPAQTLHQAPPAR